MYLVTLGDRWLFFWSDPRHHGCPHAVTEGADLIELPWRSDEWHLASTNAERHVPARSKRQPEKFKAFRSELDVPTSWEILDGVAEVWSTWEAFGRSVA